ncbi:MAG: ComEC/Rec2 family competence protein, partial [Phycisphaerales bacterium JB041]
HVLAWQVWHHGMTVASSVWFGTALVVLAAGLLRARGPGGAVLALALVLLAGGWFTARVLEMPRSSLGALLPEAHEPGGGHIVTIEGAVIEPARAWEPSGALADYLPMRGGSVAFTVRAHSAVLDDGVRRVRGRVRVTVGQGEPEISVGDLVRVRGIARAIEPPSNPGQPDPRLWATQSGQTVTITAASAALVEVLPPEPGMVARTVRAWRGSRAWLGERAAAVLPEAEGSAGRAMLAALLLGERESGAEELRATFARQGLAHVLAISGFHLAVMAGAALFAVRLTGDRGRLEPLLVALLVVLYVLILPARAPILRAATMVLVWLLAESSGRRYDKRALLAWVAIAVLVVRPMDLFSLGYQLTFGITAALVWFGEPVHARMFPGAIGFDRYEPPDAFSRRWWVDRFTRLVSASVLCWLVATPLVARSVGVISPMAAVSTVVVVPLVTALLWSSYGAMLVGVFVPPLAAAMSGVLGWCARSVVAVVDTLDGLPLTTLYGPRFSVGLTAALTALVLLWLVRGRLRSPGLWAATLLVLGWGWGEWRTAGRLPHGVALRIDTLDVGNGTCHLIRSGGEALLWDCGSLNPAIGVRTIPRVLRTLGVGRVPDVVLTHPNFDHYSGLLDVAEQLGVERVWTTSTFLARADRDPGGAAAACLRDLDRRRIAVSVWSAGEEVTLGRARALVLSPPEPAPFASDNDTSIVAMFGVQTASGLRRLLLTGDAQREALAALMTPGADLAADVLELPHHGSVQPTAMAFVDEVNPAVVLQSTGDARALDIRWNAQRLGRTWWTTATDGAAWVEIRDDGAVVSGSVRRVPE